MANTKDAGRIRQLEQQLAQSQQKLAEDDRQLASAAKFQPALVQTQARLASTEARIQTLLTENAALQQRFDRSEKRAESLAATVAASTQEAERVRQLERQLAEMQKKLAEADRQLASRSVRKLEARIASLNEQMLALRSRLDVYETKAIPYTAEERALFRTPAATNVVARTSLPSRKVSSAAAAALEASAEKNLATGELTQAEQKLAEVVRQDDREVRALCNLAITQAAQERYIEAEQTARKALTLSPDDGASLAVFGHALASQSRFEEAFDALSRAATLKPKDAGIQTLLGISLAEKGQRAQAETAFRRALQVNPDHVDAHRNLAVIYLTQQPKLVELARWHYQKSLAAGAPPSVELEHQLEAAIKDPAPE